MTDWRHSAACRDEDPELWFPIGPMLTNWRGETAVDICHRCTITDQCLRWAVDHQEDGIWAGTTAAERNTAPDEHCPKGHPYDLDNTGYGPHGRRRCRACEATRKKQNAVDHGTGYCPICGQDYRRRRPKQLYCSRSCSARANQQPGPGRKPARTIMKGG